MEMLRPVSPPFSLRLLRLFVRMLPRGRQKAIAVALPWLHRQQPVCGTFDEGRTRFAAALDEFVASRMFFHGWYEPLVTSLFLELVAPGQTVIDVGANLGYFTMLAARRVGTGGAVVAFEPDPISHCRLVQNLALNSFQNVAVEKLAVNSKAGCLEFFPVDARDANQGIAGSFAHGARGGKQKTILVDAVDLDSYCARHGIGRVDLVKMDIEGGEAAAFDGMREGLAQKRYRRVLLELHVPQLRQAGRPPEQLLAGVMDLGYSCWRVVDRSRGFFGRYSVRHRHRLVPYRAGTPAGEGQPHFLLTAECVEPSGGPQRPSTTL